MYFPIEGHPEQPTFVVQALANYRAGFRMAYSETTPELLAKAVLSHIGEPVAYTDVDIDDARRSARYLCGFLERKGE